jgi:hypothetical protein
MKPVSPLLATSIPLSDISLYLTKAADAGDGVTLMIGDMYTWGLLGGGPLLVIAGIAMVKIMFTRVKFFALEYGNGSFFGRVKVIAPFIFFGSVLQLAGLGSFWIGWQAKGYSATLAASGVTEVIFGETRRCDWADASGKADHIKSTDFWLAFSKDGHRCRLRFQQRYIGEKLQDKAIAIAEIGLSNSPLR